MMYPPAQPDPVTRRSATRLEVILATLLILSLLGGIVIRSAFTEYPPPLQHILNVVSH